MERPFLSRSVPPLWASACFALMALAGTLYALRPGDATGAGAPEVRHLGRLLATNGFAPSLADNVRFLLKLTALVPWSATCIVLSDALLGAALWRGGLRRMGGSGTCALLLAAAVNLFLVFTWIQLAGDWCGEYRVAVDQSARESSAAER